MAERIDRVAPWLLVIAIIFIFCVVVPWLVIADEAEYNRRIEHRIDQFTSLCQQGLGGEVRKLEDQLLCIKGKSVELRYTP